MRHLLTIVLPTYNRKSYLAQTLALFEPQVRRNAEEVTFIISNNASDDGTAGFLEEMYSKYPFFEYRNFTDHVDVGVSISRTCDLAETEYVLMWGDDDYPFPYTVDVILDTIKSHPDVSLIHYNRLHGKDAGIGMRELSMQQTIIGNGKENRLSVKECIDKYILDMSFLTTNVFKRSYWVNNKELDCSLHYGYEFLGKILYGMEKDYAVYIEFPLCLQRLPITRSWMQRSPLFRFIGIPNMYRDFQQWGLTDDAKSLWMRQGNTISQFIAVLSQTSMYKSVYRPLFKEICSHQYTIGRKIVAFFFIYLCPGSLSKMIRRMMY